MNTVTRTQFNAPNEQIAQPRKMAPSGHALERTVPRTGVLEAKLQRPRAQGETPLDLSGADVRHFDIR
eukprot:15446208-Alexandrium_andersonii.AAC.1